MGGDMRHIAFSITALALTLPGLAFGAKKEVPELADNVKINQIQVLGSHNSYSMGVDPRVRDLLGKVIETKFSEAIKNQTNAQKSLYSEEHPNPFSPYEMLKYKHPSLNEQLNIGLRSLELDVNPDPKGGNFLNPRAYEVLKAQGVNDLLPYDAKDMDKPGFKVLHIPDIDFRSSCTIFKNCLTEIKNWSDEHPNHIPIFIMLEVKSQDFPIFPNATHTIPMTSELYDALDAEIIGTLGREKVITPDDVRGAYPTLNAAVKAQNWPTLKQARGKIIFLMLTATGPTGATAYLDGHDNLKGRVAFLRATPESDYAAFLLIDNSLVRKDEIAKYVKEGYMVRTRSDIETYEAKINDYKRAISAFNSGAQVVSTDYELPGNDYGTSYLIKLPGGKPARCSPSFFDVCNIKK
jgi:hypothetical protein